MIWSLIEYADLNPLFLDQINCQNSESGHSVIVGGYMQFWEVPDVTAVLMFFPQVYKGFEFLNKSLHT